MNLDDQVLCVFNCLGTIAKFSSQSYSLVMKDNATGAKKQWKSQGWSDDEPLCLIKPALSTVTTIYWDVNYLDELVAHYRNLLAGMSQLVCKDLAKQWIKIVQPNKQATFPYKFKEDSKPPWWPRHVAHVEPDHMDKEGRIDLLISIIRNPNFSISSLFTRTICDDWKPAAIRYLSEMFYVGAFDRVYAFNDQEVYLNYNLTGGVRLVVSDINRRGRVVMASQVTDADINELVFPFGEGK
ncbi:hypothetical protein DICA0_C07800 [Diutina catenulata]